MGTNSLDKNFTAGDIITDTHVKQFANALEGDIVGRDSSGTPARGQRLGTPTVPFGEANVESLNVDGRFVNPRVISRSRYQLVSGGTYEETETPDGLGGWPFFLKVSNNGKIIYLDASEDTPFVAAIGETTIRLTEPISLDARTVTPSIGVRSGGTVSPGINGVLSMIGTITKNVNFERRSDYIGEVDFYSPGLANSILRLNQELTSVSAPRFVVGNLPMKDRRIYGFCYAESENESGRGLYTNELKVSGDEGAQTLGNGKIRRNIGFYPDTVDPASDEINRGQYNHNSSLTFSRQPGRGARNRVCVGLTVFLNDDSELLITTRKPVRLAVAPEDAEVNDFWYDSQQDQWNRFNEEEIWVNINAMPIGIAYFDGWVICAVESFHFDSLERSSENSVRIDELVGNDIILSSGIVSVNGKRISYDEGWDMSNEFQDRTPVAFHDEGILPNVGLPPRNQRQNGRVRGTETRPVYFYVHESGRGFYDTRRPQFSSELRGHYHPYRMARCVANFVFSFYSSSTSISDSGPTEHDYEGLGSALTLHTHEKYNLNSKKEFIYTTLLRRVTRGGDVVGELTHANPRTKVFVNATANFQNNSSRFVLNSNLVLSIFVLGPSSARALITSTHNNGNASIPTQPSGQDAFLDTNGYLINITSNEDSMTVVVEISGDAREQFILDNEIK